jgi:hypothetical protein
MFRFWNIIFIWSITMKVLKPLLSGLGIVVMLLCLPASAQHKSKVPSAQSMDKSSRLGGPITPTQPDFFANPASLSVFNADSDGQSKTINAGPLVRPIDREPAPMVDDPPRPAGGFFKVDTE